MLTECPACLTVFRVTPAILKMGRGQVRCGKCRQQFDALESLLEEDESEPSEPTAPTSPASQAPPTRPDIEVEPRPEIAEEITMEGDRIEITGTYSTRDVDISPSHDEDSGADEYARADEADAEIEIEIDAGGDPIVADNSEAESPTPDKRDAPSLPQRLWKRVRHNKQTQARAEIAAELDALTQPPPPTRRNGVWTGASIALAVLMMAQLIHHNRDALVRNPEWGGSVTRLYRALGLPLAPNWDLHAYELQQWGMVSDTGSRDALRLRASIANKATFDQPYPHIRLLMTDRWGAAVAARDFTPQEYLPSPDAADRMMAPRQRVNAEIVFIDPGADAVNFDVDPCLPAHAHPGQLLCQHDAPAPSK